MINDMNEQDYNTRNEDIGMIESPLMLQKEILQAIINRDRYDSPIPNHIQIGNVVYHIMEDDYGKIKHIDKWLARE